MAFTVKTRYGASETHDASSAADVVEQLLRELESEEFEEPDDEHTQVAVRHGDWSLTVDVSGLMTLSDLNGITGSESDKASPEAHLRAASRSGVVELLIAMAEGRVDEVRQAGWVPFEELPPFREEFFRKRPPT